MDDLFDVFVDVVDFGEVGGFDFYEWCVGQCGQVVCDFGFVDIGWVDYQDVFWYYFIVQFCWQLYVMLVVVQGDGYCVFGVVLVYDVLVQFLYDFVWGYGGGGNFDF